MNASIAHADVIFNVNTVADQIDLDVSDGICQTSTGACSLRAAIMQANHLTGPITTRIKLPAGTYTLTRPVAGGNGEDRGDLNLTSPLSAGQSIVIEGATASTSIIDANQIDRVLSIELDRVVTLSKVTVRGGYRTDMPGGGIFSEGALTLLDSIIEANASDSGGGGVHSKGTLDIRRSILRSNTGNSGGAAYVAGVGTIRDSSLYGNASHVVGGAIAVSFFPEPATLVILNSTISNNAANLNGGGIYNEGNTFLYNTSIIGNDADHDRDQLGGVGGGVNNHAGSRLVAVNSLIADNTILDAPIPDDCNGQLEVYGWNLLSDFTACTFSGNGVAGRGYVSGNTIGPLTDNGGPTPTHALLAGSEAIDTTTVQGCIDDSLAALATDQRGAPRIAGLRCDVGAFEYDSVVPTPDLIFRDGFDSGM
ncbi:MAG: choice-of-anchor Q domain-containing protein [Dokdonella sp.]